MTIVLQHQFWDLKVDEEAGLISVGLSFGGAPASLVIPLDALTAFADPAVNFGLGFQPIMPDDAAATTTEAAAPAKGPTEAAESAAEAPAEAPQVVSLDAFRRRPPSKS
jgi:hypothetical protein